MAEVCSAVALHPCICYDVHYELNSLMAVAQKRRVMDT